MFGAYKMAWIHKILDVTEKFSILSQDSQYDLACSCGTNDADRRHRSKDDKWIYPVTLSNGKRLKKAEEYIKFG